MKNNFILFDESSKTKLLEVMDKAVDSNGLIVEKSNPIQKVKTKEGNNITKEEFAGVRKGSEIFIKNDLNSILDLADLMEIDATQGNS